MKLNSPALILSLLILNSTALIAQQCSLPTPPLQVKRANLFTPQQEQWLGDAQADMLETSYTLLPASESAYLDQIGQRLLSQLPPTPIHYTFRVYESPDLRAFSLAGGHVYISRKLIMDARNEDELAAMLAQEIGRIYIHHAASAVTRRMRHTLHVKQLTDRADVYDKFERMLNIPTDFYSYLDYGEQQSDELLADRVGLYALVKAHYNPAVFPDFLDRVNDNGGYTGNPIFDFFGTTPMISVRVHMAQKAVSALPPACRQPRPAFHPGFENFQQQIRYQRINPIVPPSTGLHATALPQPLNPALGNVAISPDAKYILAQDTYQIHILSANPLKYLFSIDALNSQLAQFTPDSQGIVFNYNDLHVEKWQLDNAQPAQIFDYADYAGCTQTALSPDGSTLACVSQFQDSILDSTWDAVWLKLIDLQSGNLLYQNQHFFDTYSFRTNPNVHTTSNFMAIMHWSRDGRYFVAASGVNAMAYDLTAHAVVPLQGTLASLSQQHFAFVGSGKMVSTCDWSPKFGGANETFTMCYTSFPAGKTIKKLELPYSWLSSISAGDRILLGPVANAAAILYDPQNAKPMQRFRNQSIDLNNNLLAVELPQGGIAVGNVDGAMQELTLPVTPVTTVEASAFSLNGRYLALSDRARGALWDLQTNQRLQLSNPFLYAAISDQGQLQAAPVDHEIYPAPDPAADRLMKKYIPGVSTLQYPMQFGSVRLQVKPLNVQNDFTFSARLTATDAANGARLWSKTFNGPVPQLVLADGDKTLLVQGHSRWEGHAKTTRTSDLSFQGINPLGLNIQILDNRTGKPIRTFYAPQPLTDRLDSNSTPTDHRTAGLFGNLLAVYGNHNDTTLYDATTGKRLFACFGLTLAGDDSLHRLATTNRIQELNIYNTTNGNLLAHFLLDQAVLNARFLPAQNQLLVLTAAQTVYRIDLTKLTDAN